MLVALELICWSLGEDDTTINNNSLARHVVAVLARQEAHRVAYILWHTCSAKGNQLIGILLDRIALLRTTDFSQLLINEIPHGGADNTWCVSVDRDLVRSHFHCEGLSQAANGPLGGAVVGQESKRLERYDGSSSKYFAATPLGYHLLCGCRVAVVNTKY